MTERCVKKSVRLPFFYPKLFVCLLFRHSSLFFVHSGFLFGIIKERKNRDVFRDTRTRTELRERKKEHHGEERGTLCFVCDTQQKKRKSIKKTFAPSRDDDDEKSSFFFNLLFPFPGGHPFFERMTMCRASRTTTTTTTTTLCASLQRERVRQFSPS